MTSVSISHIIGISAMVIVVLTLEYSYTVIISGLEREKAERELQNIAEYVSSQIYNVYSLAVSTNYPPIFPENISKILDISAKMGGKGLNVSIESQSGELYVKTFFIGDQTVYGLAKLSQDFYLDPSYSSVRSGKKEIYVFCYKLGEYYFVGIDAKRST